MDRIALLDEHAAAGARLSTSEPALLLTYGDVPAEYRAATEGCALFDDSDRGRLRASGPDAAGFLHRITANDVRALAVGAGQRNLLLSPKGKVNHEFELYRTGEAEFVLSVPAGRARALLAALDLYLFSEKVVLAAASEDYAPLVLVGPRSDDVAARVLGRQVPQREYAWSEGTFEGAALVAARTRYAGSSAIRIACTPAQARRLWPALHGAGAQPAGVVVRDILRVEAGAALYGVDVDENVYPQEARLEDAFSLDKGCYTGQEVIAKIDTYGGLNKRLVALRISHDDPIAHGTRLYRRDDEPVAPGESEWRDLGLVTSWAYSFVLDTGLVLAYVKRRHQQPGTVFRVGEGPATAVIVPLPVRPGALAVSGGFE